MKIHILGQSYAPTQKHQAVDVFPGKIWRMCWMLKSLGYEVIHYGIGGSNPPCDGNVVTLTQSELDELLPPKDYSQECTPTKIYEINTPWSKAANEKSVQEIKTRIKPGDVVFYFGGNTQKEIASKLGPGIHHIEPSVGYDGMFAPCCVFQSYSHMHRMYGYYKFQLARPWDAVIPNAYDVDDFEFCNKPEEYLLFMGRCMHNKGLGIAMDVAMQTGHRLLIAGHGVTEVSESHIKTFDGATFQKNKNIEFIGYLPPKERAKVLRQAKALMMPTLYCEPFGNLAIEAMLCGTPVISTDWGSFTELVQNGVNGFRCRLMPDFIKSVELISSLDRIRICQEAQEKYLITNIRYLYSDYLSKLPKLNP